MVRGFFCYSFNLEGSEGKEESEKIDFLPIKDSKRCCIQGSFSILKTNCQSALSVTNPRAAWFEYYLCLIRGSGSKYPGNSGPMIRNVRTAGS